jgi:CRP/FNR family transcriptional regulator
LGISNFLANSGVGTPVAARSTDLIAIKLHFDFPVQHYNTYNFVTPDTQMTPALPPNGRPGPAVRALDPWMPSNPSPGRMHQLLSNEERARLAVIASVVRFKKGAEIYREGDRADAVFNIISGAVKAYQRGANDTEHVVAFLFPDDVLGLAQEGQYVNSIKTLTPVTAYRIPVSALRSRLAVDAALEFHVIAKLCHELREAQRHAFLLSHKRTLSKLAMFLQMMEQLQAANGEATNEIYLPMDRSDIADYVGTTLAALSRAFRTLTVQGILQCRNRRHVKIVDRDGFDKLADNVS